MLPCVISKAQSLDEGIHDYNGGNGFISLMSMFSTDVVSDQHWTVNKLSSLASERRSHSLILT